MEKWNLWIVMASVLMVMTRTGVRGSQDNAIQTRHRRLLLNDPNTLLNHIEALQQEMTLLKSQFNSLKTEVNTCKTEINTLNLKMNSLETRLNDQKLDLSTIKTVENNLTREVNALNTNVTTMNTQLSSQSVQLSSLQNQITHRNQNGSGGVYTVWGKKICPIINGTATIYTGITGGKDYHTTGSGVNNLCLPHNPDDAPHDFPTNVTDTDRIPGLYGSEYEFSYKNIFNDDDVPCAVCHLNAAVSVLMIPAKLSCPVNWNMQYNGYLVTQGNIDDLHAYDYICLHHDAGYLTEGKRQYNRDGHILFPVQAACGSLPCPPYRNGQYITCVVCTL